MSCTKFNPLPKTSNLKKDNSPAPNAYIIKNPFNAQTKTFGYAFGRYNLE